MGSPPGAKAGRPAGSEGTSVDSPSGPESPLGGCRGMGDFWALGARANVGGKGVKFGEQRRLSPRPPPPFIPCPPLRN